MEREDDFETRRVKYGIDKLSDEELYNKFWELTAQVVDPLIELGRNNTSPSIERSVLLRMGVSSLDTQTIVKGCMDNGLLGHGAGNVVYRIAKEKNLSIKDAASALAAGKYWDDANAIFKKGAK
ncbi:MAG: ornithine aminomutase subunit alpha [Eubacterium sp.]|jgi:D-ornithine 4,5-aminomutase subunit alpha